MQVFLDKTYAIVILINLLFSFYLLIFKRKSKQQFHFYIYISAVFIADVLFSIVKQEYFINSNYIFFPFILISYFYFFYFYKRNLKNKYYQYLWTLVSVFFWIATIVAQVQNSFEQLSSTTLALLPLYYIFGSLGWFVYILVQKIEGNIFDKMSFWICSGLLIWSVFFLFKGLPMYYLNISDPIFFSNISKIFTVVNIITYLFFLRSIFCSQ